MITKLRNTPDNLENSDDTVTVTIPAMINNSPDNVNGKVSILFTFYIELLARKIGHVKVKSSLSQYFQVVSIDKLAEPLFV